MGEVPTKKKSRKTQNVARMKLPGIESYEKELEFTAEGPGRVVVRLERLMGSDRIRITDPKYLATLMERLEAEETSSWVVRSRLRKKAERNRSRQLAIDGLMEPAEDMQDLYNHPVFRVNRVLKRLAVFDQTMSSHPGATSKVPPIRPVEPFSEDDSGGVFKKYSGHAFVFTDELPDYVSQTAISNTGMLLGRTNSEIILEAKEMRKKKKKEKAEGVSKTPSKKAQYRTSEEGDEYEDEEEGDEGDEEEGDDDDSVSDGDDFDQNKELQLFGLPDTLEELQQLYGVASSENLTQNWQPFKSHLADVVYEDSEDMTSLYLKGNDVEGVYHRQYITVDEHATAIEQKVKRDLESGAYNTPTDTSEKEESKMNVASKVTVPKLASGGDDEEGEDEDEGEKDEELEEQDKEEEEEGAEEEDAEEEGPGEVAEE